MMLSGAVECFLSGACVHLRVDLGLPPSVRLTPVALILWAFSLPTFYAQTTAKTDLETCRLLIPSGRSAA